MKSAAWKWIFATWMLFASIGLAAVAWKQHRVPRIGIVDNGLLMGQFTESVQARAQLDSLRAEQDANTRQLSDSLDKALELLKRDYEYAPSSRKTILRAAVADWNQKLNGYRKTSQTIYLGKEQELIFPVIRKMNAYIGLWGREHGFDALLGSGNQGGVVLMAQGGIDVTAEVLTGLNAMYAVPRTVAKAADSAKTTAMK